PFNRAAANCIDNSLRFTADGTSIRMSVSGAPETTELSVTDTGFGIGPEHLPHVFERFYRADPSRSSGGTGLGLALVKSIVDLHGGSTTIRSNVPGGTTVTLAFPTSSI